MAMAMACFSLLHSPSLSISHALLHSPCSRRLLRFSSPNLRRFSSAISVHPPLGIVTSQARRGFSLSSSKKDEAASPADLYFESPLKIVEYPDPILRRKNKRIGVFDDKLKNLVHEMFDVMYKTDGIGLSAPQVGVNVQLMVFNPEAERGKGEEIVLINPRIVKYSPKRRLFNEGCLSFPQIYGDVERPESVKIEAQDVTGAKFAVNLSGLPARVFQHEFDHLQGILFFERMSEEILGSIAADLVGLEKKFEDKTGHPSPKRVQSRRRRQMAVGFGNQKVKN